VDFTAFGSIFILSAKKNQIQNQNQNQKLTTITMMIKMQIEALLSHAPLKICDVGAKLGKREACSKIEGSGN